MSDIKKYLIVRVAKYKSNAGISGEIDHNNRVQGIKKDGENFDVSKKHLNIHMGITDKKAIFEKLKERISTTTRKARPDANKIMEYVYSASPEWMETQTQEQKQAFFEKGIEYLKEKHGADNVLGSWIHYDESSPHMHVFVCPLVKTMKFDKKKNIEVEDIRLNTKHYMNGKVGCSILQTDIHQACGVPFGLDRGIQKTGIKHVEQKEWRIQKLKTELAEAEKLRLRNESFYIANDALNKKLKLSQVNHDLNVRLLNQQETLFKAKSDKLDKRLAGFNELKTLVEKPELLGMISFLDKSKAALDIINAMKQDENLASYFADSMRHWEDLGIAKATNNWSNDGNASSEFLKALAENDRNQENSQDNDLSI